MYESAHKIFSFSGPLTPHQWICPWTPMGTPPQTPVIVINSRSALFMVRPLWEIVDPPLLSATFDATGLFYVIAYIK